MTQLKVLVVLINNELFVGKNHARNGEWIDITIKMIGLKDSTLTANFNTRSILFPKSQAVNECLQLTKVPTDHESSKESGSELQTPLPSLKIFKELLQALSQNYKAQPYQYAFPSKQILKSKAKPYPPFTHCGFNNHRPDDCRNYPECEICKSYSCQIWSTRMVENQNDVKVKQIRTDSMTEFRNSELESFCDEKGISYNFSYLYTPKQIGVAKRKNGTLIEAARTIKFDAKADDGYFLGYSFVSKAVMVYNTRRQQIKKTYHVTFDESIEAIRKGMLTRSMTAKLTAASASECLFVDFLFEMEPKKVFEALKHPERVDVMQEELNQFHRNKVWTLVPLYDGKIAIGSKWMFMNKKDEHGSVTKNKEILVAQGYSLEEGIDYNKTFASVAKIKAIKIFLAFDPKPPTDNSEARPLMEFIIKFTVMNDKKPLTLDFKTFWTKVDIGIPPLDEGTHKSKPLLEGKPTNLKNSEGNKQPDNMGLPSIVPDEGISKTKPLLEGENIKDKDSERFKPLTNMESSTLPVTDKLLEESDDDMFEAGEEMDKDIQEHETEETHTHQSTKEPHLQKHQSPPHPKEQPESSRAKQTNASDSESSLYFEKISSHMTTICQLLKGNWRILENLKEVRDAIKEDHALNKKVIKAVEAYTKNSTTLTKLITLVKNFNFPGLKTNVTHTATKETPSYTEGEKDDMVTEEAVEKEPTKEHEPTPELEMIGSSSRIQFTDIILEILIPQHISRVINITLREQPESPPPAPNANRGKGKSLMMLSLHQSLSKPWKRPLRHELIPRFLQVQRVVKSLERFRMLKLRFITENTLRRSRGRKRKHQELELETRIPSLECNRSLPEGIFLINNMVIEQPEHGMFFIDVFGDEAF
uniref:Retrovirus-related Pol polyprotein from transposon TNT 1-94 n=1 Tax=Tanacetum cinerariifolium TaxID=118510 RepID=A0A6L2JR45_TANCI|nr:retrovirus-related Pol polyprotein from transposon TNT 1-94 [Tanacetum cinerariifolium]